MLGWATLVLLIPASVGSFARISAEALTALFNLPTDGARDTGIALAVVGLCTAANLGQVRTSARVQSVVSAAKYAGVLLLAVLGLCCAGAASGGAGASPAGSATPVLQLHSGWAASAR